MLIGIGTALVDPTLTAAVGDVAHPTWRSTAVGVYRLWRDTGSVIGVLLGGLIADLIDLRAAGEGPSRPEPPLMPDRRRPDERGSGPAEVDPQHVDHPSGPCDTPSSGHDR